MDADRQTTSSGLGLAACGMWIAVGLLAMAGHPAFAFCLAIFAVIASAECRP